MKFIQMSLLASTIVLFTACGSIEDLVESFDPGDDDYTPVSFTGQFVDTYVKGLNYTCIGYIDGVPDLVTDSGVTNEKGEFTCSNRGELVEFSVGNYVIGSYQNSGFDDDTAPIVTPYSLSLSQEAAINLAQLLQTLNDGSTEGALTIPANFTALDNVDIKLDDFDFDALMADALPNVTALVSEEVAEAHLAETIAALTPTDPTPTTGGITQAMLDDKTFYSYEEDTNYDNAVIERMWSKMTFIAGTLSRTEYIEEMNGDTVVNSFSDSFTLPYEIIDGQITLTVPPMEGDLAEDVTFSLVTETAEYWVVLDEGDENQDGTIDWTGTTTLYLSKPAGYPESL